MHFQKSGYFHAILPEDFEVHFDYRVIPGQDDPVAIIPARIDYTLTVTDADPDAPKPDPEQFFREKVYDRVAEATGDARLGEIEHRIIDTVIELMVEAYHLGAAS